MLLAHVGHRRGIGDRRTKRREPVQQRTEAHTDSYEQQSGANIERLGQRAADRRAKRLTTSGDHARGRVDPRLQVVGRDLLAQRDAVDHDQRITEIPAWSMAVIMKIDLAGPRQRCLAVGLNEFAGYLAVGLTALATGYLASVYGLRLVPFYLGIAYAMIGLLLSWLLVRETDGFTQIEHAVARAHPPPTCRRCARSARVPPGVIARCSPHARRGWSTTSTMACHGAFCRSSLPRKACMWRALAS